MEMKRMNIDTLKPAPYNPRVDLRPGDSDYEKLKQSIEKFGHVQPIVWNEQTGYVVGGHQSLVVLQDLGETEVDCVVVNMSPTDEKTLNVALNKITGRWDMDRLAELMEELVEDGMAAYTGYEEKEIEKITQQAEQSILEAGELDPEEFDDEAFANKCPRCGFLYD